MQEILFNYQKVYLLLPLVGSRQDKERDYGYISTYQLIGLVSRVFTNGQKMVLDTSLLNIQQYKVCIKGKVEQSRERSNGLLYTSV